MIEPKKIPRKEFKRHNRRSFLLAGINMLCGAFGLRWVLTSDGDKDMTPDALQQGFLANEKFWKRIFSPQRQNSATPAPPTSRCSRISGTPCFAINQDPSSRVVLVYPMNPPDLDLGGRQDLWIQMEPVLDEGGASPPRLITIVGE